MVILFLSLLASLSVGFLIKLLKINNLFDFFVLIANNYLIAFLLGIFLFDIRIDSFVASHFPYLHVVFLGVFMPTVFIFLNKSLKTSGLARTDIFQRLSLIIPLILSFWFFKEEFTLIKLFAIILTFISIVLLLYKKSTNNGNFNLFYLLVVFFSYGIIDTLFKIIATNPSINYTSVLVLIFGLCLLTTFIGLFFTYKNTVLKPKLLYFGWLMGFLNFFNIYFYMKAHKIFADNPTLVFISMNLGVIIGGSLIGKFYFKEKFSKLTLIGILTAVLTIILLALIQLKIL